MAFDESLVVRMGLDKTSFERGLTTIPHSLEGINEKLGKLGFGIEAGMVVEGVKALAEYADQLKAVAEVTGLTTDELQGFEQMVSVNGGTQEKAAKGLEKFSENIGKAHSGVAESVALFDKWNIRLEDNHGYLLSTEDVLKGVADAMAAMPDPTTRAAMAADLFGAKAGMSLVPALSKGSAALEDFNGKVDKFGLTKEQIKGITSAKDELERMDHWLMSVGASIFNFFDKHIKHAAQAFGAISAGGGISNIRKTLQELRAEEEKSNKPDEEVRQKAEAIIDRAKMTEELSKLEEKLGQVEQANAQKSISSNDVILALDARKAQLMEDADRFAEGSAEKQHRLNMVAMVDGAIQQRKRQDEEDKLADLTEQKVGLYSIIDSLEDNSIEKKKKQIELAELEGRIIDQNKKIEEDRIKQAEAMIDARHKLADAEADLKETKADRNKFTLEELANSRIRFSGHLGQEQMDARQAIQLEGNADWNKLHGNRTLADQQTDLALQLRHGLDDVKSRDRDPYGQQERQINALKAVVRKLSSTLRVMPIVPPSGGGAPQDPDDSGI